MAVTILSITSRGPIVMVEDGAHLLSAPRSAEQVAFHELLLCAFYPNNGRRNTELVNDAHATGTVTYVEMYQKCKCALCPDGWWRAVAAERKQCSRC